MALIENAKTAQKKALGRLSVFRLQGFLLEITPH